MLDDLREQAGNMDFLTDDEESYDYNEILTAKPTLFMGVTPVQRFVIAVLLMLMTCLLSTFCLLVTEKITLPFF